MPRTVHANTDIRNPRNPCSDRPRRGDRSLLCAVICLHGMVRTSLERTEDGRASNASTAATYASFCPLIPVLGLALYILTVAVSPGRNQAFDSHCGRVACERRRPYAAICMRYHGAVVIWTGRSGEHHER
ncbi:hypothetical protein M433DRAFT_148990 [Acidomyces richmondensis BFW]|nr:MAG: hypothetical protein FE78DRAFT_85685 [Acidomyces sp. 'richmondensis']KYG50381.1 hypothetical protein M433DRAFT_148990 [Acidomyces richmondensis BFW]